MNFIFKNYFQISTRILFSLLSLSFFILPTSVLAVNFTPLTNAINGEYTDGANRSVITLLQSDYTGGSWNTYIRAVTIDAILIENDTSSTQSDINNMVTIITNAKAGLIFISASNLTSAVNASSSKVQSDYSTTSWALFQNAVVLADALPQTTNAEVITKTNAILSAITLLTTDKTTLTQSITNEVGSAHASPVYIATSTDYTGGSWNTYVNSINTAITIEASTTAVQSVINSAITSITTSKASLVLLSLKEITTYTFPIGIQSVQENSLSVSVIVPMGTDVTNLIATFSTTGANVAVGSTVQISGVTTNNFSSPVAYRVTAADGSIKSYTVRVRVLNANEVSQNSTGTTTLSASSSQVVFVDQMATTTIEVGTSTVNGTLDLSALLVSGTGTLPATFVTTSLVAITFPAGVRIISSSTTWDGIFSLPTVTTVSLPTLTGFTKTASLGIMVGLTNHSLYFDKGVRMRFVGEAGKKVSFAIGRGTVTDVTDICSSDTQAVGDGLASYTECKMDVGSDLIIWTKHFTSFVTYTQTANAVSSGGGGGGGGGGGFVSSSNTTTVSSPVSSLSQQAVQPTVVNSASINAGGEQVLGVSAFYFYKNLKLASKGRDVTELQKILISENILRGKPTGYFGILTKKALITWQKLNGIPAIGYFGPVSRLLINKGNI